jgi:hypothetical protein
MPTWNPGKSGPESSRRRSQRVILSLPVTVRTADGVAKDAAFEESTQTLIVNAHGALIALAGKVEKAQILRLTNRATKEVQLCHVVHLGPLSGGKAQVGIEFKSPAPDFWRIAFPPEDWTAPEPEPAVSKSKKP